jgi:Glyoxalase-like domain
MDLLQLDHLVVAATTLADGIEHVESQLGVPMQPGGKHAFMGTHNALLKLGTGCYLEVIALDPDAMRPARPRWFNLDRLKLLQPRLIHWVARTNAINTASREYPFCGQIVSASRGNLHWKITIPDDGALPYDGAFPTIIEWPQGTHVSERMNDQGCTLESLMIQHENATSISNLLGQYTFAQKIDFASGPTTISATISTPDGPRTLS